MAKRSGTASRKAPSRRAGSTRKKVARKATRSTRKRTRRGLDLKELRRNLDLAISVLSRRLAKGPKGAEPPVEPSAKIQETVTLMSRWASEIDDICDPDEQQICGPSMVIEIS